MEMRGKKKGGSNGENLREWEKKRNCPFDTKKVCPVTMVLWGKPNSKTTIENDLVYCLSTQGLFYFDSFLFLVKLFLYAVIHNLLEI